MEEQYELDQPVTRREFRKDIADIRKDISGVKESIDFIIQNGATKEDLRTELARYATKEDLTQFKSDILTGVDKVLKQVTTIREEQIMKTGRDDQQDKRLNSIEMHVGLHAMN